MDWFDVVTWEGLVGPNLGLDWAAVALGSVALVSCCRDARSALTLSMIANVIWLSLGLRTGSLAITLGNLGFLIFDARSRLRRWGLVNVKGECS